MSMQNTYYVKGNEGFALSFMVDGDVIEGESVTAIVEVSGTQKQYPLFKRCVQNKLHFSRRFFWVDREYVLRVLVYRNDVQEDEKRIVVKIADSNHQGSFSHLREMLQQINYIKEGTCFIESPLHGSQHIAEQLKRYLGNAALDPLLQLLGTTDEVTRWKVVRVLSWIKDRDFLAPVYLMLGQETEGPVAAEIISLFRSFPSSAIQNLAIQTLRKSSLQHQRLFAVELLSGNRFPAAQDALRDAADFDPNIKVKERARAALTVNNSNS